MATKQAILAVKIIADAKDFKKGTDDAATALDKFKGKMNKLTVPALAVGAGLLKVGSDFGQMASDFEQNSGAVDAVFKGMSKQVDELASGSAKKLGLSANDYKKYASLIGSQLKNAGTPMDQLVGKTDMLLNTGADFAAQFGGTVPDAVAALSSALKGEMDPIEKYGISLNQSKIDAEAAALGFSKVNGELTDQQKQAAIMSLINKQGADSMGANAREATTAAGAQARLTAAYGDMGVKLGTALLPVMGQVASVLGTVVDWVSQNTQLVQTLAVGLGILAAAVLVLNGVMLVMNAIALVNPWVLLAVAVAALIGFIVYLATQTTFFQDLWVNFSKGMAIIWEASVKFITDVWNGFVGWITDGLNGIGSFFGSIFAGIGRFVGDVVNNIRNFFAGAFAFIGAVVQAYISLVIGIIRGIINVVSSVVNFISQGFASAFNFVAQVVGNVVNFFVNGFNSIVNAVSNVISWVRQLFNGFSVPGWLRDVMKFMGVGGTGFDMAVGYDLSGLPAGMGATGTPGFGGIFGGGGSATVTNVVNNINVNGAVDPISTARQIKKILNDDGLRNGKISAGGQLF